MYIEWHRICTNPALVELDLHFKIDKQMHYGTVKGFESTQTRWGEEIAPAPVDGGEGVEYNPPEEEELEEDDEVPSNDPARFPKKEFCSRCRLPPSCTPRSPCGYSSCSALPSMRPSRDRAPLLKEWR